MNASNQIIGKSQSIQELQSAEEVTEEEEDEEDECGVSSTESDSDEEEATTSFIHHQTKIQWGKATLHC